MPGEDAQNSGADFGAYIMLDGRRRELAHHPTDFSVDSKKEELKAIAPELPDDNIRQLAIGMSRVTSDQAAATDELMAKVRKEKVAHHIYRLADTGEEIAITDRIFLKLREENEDEVRAIARQYNLKREKQRENIYTLMVTSESGRNPTSESGRNPLKIANEIAATRSDVIVSCTPEILLPMRFSCAGAGPAIDIKSIIDQHPLFKDQWHLSAGESGDDRASIKLPEAWKEAKCMGDPEIVIAVIDDGFDLPRHAQDAGRHRAFARSIIDTDHMKNFGDGAAHDDDEGALATNVFSRDQDFHGTCVASIIAASGDAMLGVVPRATFLPIRIGAISNLQPRKLLDILEEISAQADVVNCSFSMKPRSYSLSRSCPDFAPRIKKLVGEGGRRGKGLVIVFAAGNDDAPITLSKRENKNGVSFVQNKLVEEDPERIPPKHPVYCGFTEINGVVVVGAVTSLLRKAAYSNWGRKITVVAPSSNGHDITRLRLRGNAAAILKRFPGRGIIAAINRAGHGEQPRDTTPIQRTPPLQDPYIGDFGQTSAAAAIVSGVIGLMLSANPNLKADEVIEILKSTADKDLDLNLDLPGDTNLQGFTGKFDGKGHSLFFGAGKVNALEAVREALRRINRK